MRVASGSVMLIEVKCRHLSNINPQRTLPTEEDERVPGEAASQPESAAKPSDGERRRNQNERAPRGIINVLPQCHQYMEPGREQGL